MPLKTKSSPGRPRSADVDELREENRRLRGDLFLVRMALVDLTDAQGLLDGYFSCEDYEQLAEWRQERAAAVIQEASIRPGEEMGDERWPRAICPLCRQGAQGTKDVRGYAVPEGLRRHLLGELNSRQCVVFAAAEVIARDSIHDAKRTGRHWIQA